MFERDEESRRDTSWRWSSNSPVDRFEGMPDGQEPSEPVHPLETDASLSTFARLLGHYYRELDRQADEREAMAVDEDMADHIQWTEEEIAALAERGQDPLTFNVIKTSLEWILGTQRMAPMDYRVLPRSEAGLKHAERKTQLMKHLADVNHFGRATSRAFRDAVTVGVGWLECGASSGDDGEPIYERNESWRNMLWDTTALEDDLSDARYIFRAKWVDVDEALARFPARSEAIRSAVDMVYEAGASIDGGGDDPMDSQEDAHLRASSGFVNTALAHGVRERVRLFEGWHTKIIPTVTVHGGEFNGDVFDEWSPGHVGQVNAGNATLVTKPRRRMMASLFTKSGLLHYGPSPYRHNRYPFTPIWGFRRGRDGMPYGYVRGVKDIQRDLNKRASKMLWALSSSRVFYQKGSVENPETLRNEAARPDAMIEYDGGHPAPVIDDNSEMAAAHADRMAMDIQMIQQTGGVTDENMGRRTNATSGKAIVARQEQGGLATSAYFDNLRHARVLHGEKALSLIEQYYTEQKKFRITNNRGNPEYVSINDPGTDVDDAITATKADFILDEEDWRASLRQAQVDALFEVMQMLAASNPAIVSSVLDLLVEMMDVPKRDEIVKRIRQVTGAVDPDADPENPDADTIALMEQKAKQAAFAERAAVAELAEKEAKATKAAADTARIIAGLPAAELQNLNDALVAAEKLAAVPGLGKVADLIRSHAEAEATKLAEAALAGAGPAAAPSPPSPTDPLMEA